MTAPLKDPGSVKSTKLFGTDGIRGTSNQYPMVPDVQAHRSQYRSKSQLRNLLKHFRV